MQYTTDVSPRNLQACKGGKSGGAYIIEVQQLLLVVADIKVDVGVWSAEFECGQIIGQGSLLLGIKPAQINLLALLPDVSLPPLCPVHDEAHSVQSHFTACGHLRMPNWWKVFYDLASYPRTKQYLQWWVTPRKRDVARVVRCSGPLRGLHNRYFTGHIRRAFAKHQKR